MKSSWFVALCLAVEACVCTNFSEALMGNQGLFLEAVFQGLSQSVAVKTDEVVCFCRFCQICLWQHPGPSPPLTHQDVGQGDAILLKWGLPGLLNTGLTLDRHTGVTPCCTQCVTTASSYQDEKPPDPVLWTSRLPSERVCSPWSYSWYYTMHFSLDKQFHLGVQLQRATLPSTPVSVRGPSALPTLLRQNLCSGSTTRCQAAVGLAWPDVPSSGTQAGHSTLGRGGDLG